jgi:hypothetical protein
MSAEIVVMADCASNYGTYQVPGSKGATWVVSLNGSEGPVHCSCPAYKYSRDQACKHCDLVLRQACLYNPQCGPGREDPAMVPVSYNYDKFVEGACPMCGGPMVAVRRAV